MRQLGADTHPGYHRKNNEDSFVAAPELGLWLVADGVGGHDAGEMASAIVGATVRESIANGRSLDQAIMVAHQAVLTEIGESRDSSDMGSTVVALLMRDDEYEIGWVGDSRAYLWDGRLSPLTQDHNPVSELLARGLISNTEAAQHPERHVLTQCLGISRNMRVNPGLVHGQLTGQQQFLLCSDGLTDELSDAVIASHLAAQDTPQQQADALLGAALAAGGRDNITLIILGTEHGKASEIGKVSPSAAPVTPHAWPAGHAEERQSLCGQRMLAGALLASVVLTVLFLLS